MGNSVMDGMVLTPNVESVKARVFSLPPWWVLLYMGSIFAAGVAGSSTDTLAGANVEHVLLGGSLGLAVMFLLFEGNFRRIAGLNRVLKYLSLFAMAIFLGFLSSIHPGPKIVGSSTLVYWCGLVVSIGVAALAALRGHTRWVLLTVALGGIPVAASVITPLLPALGRLIPIERLSPIRNGRISGVFWNPNATGFMLYCGLAGSLCGYHVVRHATAKSICVCLSVLYGVTIFMTLSRASILVMLVTGLVFLCTLCRKAPRRWALLLLMLGLLAIGVQEVSTGLKLPTLRSARLLNTSLYEDDTFRFQGLARAARNTGSLFALGEGSRQFVDVSGAYIGRWGKAAHNQIVAVWVEWGLLALLLMYSAHLWVVVCALKNRSWNAGDSGIMLMAVYLCILLYLQLHETNSPASCALLGLCAGDTFARRAILSGAAVRRENAVEEIR